MAKDPAFLFYTGDFSTGTQFFTDEQVGKYLRLLMAQHQHGHLHEKQVIIICKTHDNEVMSKFIKDGDGLFYNERLEIEILKRKAFSASRSKNKLGKTKQDDEIIEITSKSYDNHMEDENKDINIIKSNKVNIGFEDFWNLYDKKVDRKNAELKWGKLTDEERLKAIEHIPKYINANPDKQFRKNPDSYITNKSFNDEIIGLPTSQLALPIQEKEKKEYWEIHWGHLYKTKEEFMQAVNDGLIDY